MKKIKIKLFAVCLLVFAIVQLFFITPRANAFDFNAQLEGKVPADLLFNIASHCNNDGWSIVAAQWLSVPNSPASTSVTVAEGTSSIVLDLNYINYRCKPQVSPYALSETFYLYDAAYTNLGSYENTTYYPANQSNQYNSGILKQITYNRGTPLTTGLYPINYNNAGFFKRSNETMRCAKQTSASYSGAPTSYYPPWGCEVANDTFVISVITQPKPNYLGQIQTQKRMNALGDPFVTDLDLLNAKTYVEPCGNPATCVNSNARSDRWATGGYMWTSSSGPTYNGTSGTTFSTNDVVYSSKIDVPSGYRVNRVQLSRDANATANTPVLSCDGAKNTGTCSTPTKVWNGGTTFVDWYLEKILPTLTVTCTSDNPTTGGKITVTASSPLGTNTVAIKGDTDINPPATPQNITGSYTFDIASKYRDGGVHTYYATYDGLSKSVAFGPGQACNIDKWFYPWLQTSQGDVVADGKIEGQTTSTGTGTLGARLDSAASKEAEFLVISAVADGGPFCSTYKYILTNINSQSANNCGNGAGYNFNSTGIDNDTVDRVIGGVKQAFADNGNNANSAPSACSASGIATATVTAMPAKITTDCPGGVIYKLSSTTLGRTVLLQGRATIFVDGPLTITDDLLANRAQVDPRLAPALAIVVSGDINIASTVGFIDAQLYSAKKINTCTATANECSIKRLNVNGSLSAKTGFEFKRTYVEPSNLAVYREPAESIKMTGMHLAFPPPGIDSRYFYNNFSSYKLDSAEYNPRF
jgi:hypothetical protein